jgi:L-glyceraldehyde 3-phosphate reductase
VTEEKLNKVRALQSVARRRNQTLAQLALSWVLRHPGVTSALIGASSVAQLEDNVAASFDPPLSDEDLSEIDGILR